MHSPPPKRMKSNGASIRPLRETQDYQSYNGSRFDQPANARVMGPPSAVRYEAMNQVAPEVDHMARLGDPGYKSALRAWARFRFVRAGWFTPAEAILYIE